MITFARVSIILVIISFIFVGCAPWSSPRRGKLSEAMEKAAENDKEKRTIEAEEEDEEEIVEYGTIESQTQPQGFMNGDTSSTKAAGSNFTKIGLSFGSGILESSDYYGLNHIHFYFGGDIAERWRAYLSAGLGWAPIQQTSQLSKSIDGSVILLNAGLEFQRFSTPSYTFIGHYFLFGFDYNLLLWSYKNPIEIRENGRLTETISSDMLRGLGVYAGTGLNIIQTRHVLFGGSACPGTILWIGSTREGFDNDVFKNFMYIKFKLFLQVIL